MIYRRFKNNQAIKYTVDDDLLRHRLDEFLRSDFAEHNTDLKKYKKQEQRALKRRIEKVLYDCSFIFEDERQYVKDTEKDK